MHSEFFLRLKPRIGAQVCAVFRDKKSKPVRERRLITSVSDKLGQIKRASMFFYRIAKFVHGVPIARRRCGLKFNNNPVERHNEDIKQRYNILRHLKFRLGRSISDPAENFLQFCQRAQEFRRDPCGSSGDGALGKNRFGCLVGLAVRL